MLAKLPSLAVVGMLALATTAQDTCGGGGGGGQTPANPSDRLVFSHFMIGICSNRNSPADYDEDMQRAKAHGIDAFALNIGVDPYTDTQLNFAYESAANNDMKVFISFDFNWWSINQPTAIGQEIAQYASRPAQLMVDNKVFVSSFAGDGVDVAQMQAGAGRDIYFVPNFHPGVGDFSTIQGALSWMAWPSNGRNRAPTAANNVSVAEADQMYLDALNGKPYMAPAASWFFTHFGDEVSYSKNWVFPSDLLWYNRWNALLQLGPRFIEHVTWNDYGESHYMGPLSSPHTDDGASKWVMDMPHNGWLEMSKPWVAAYKAGETSPDNFIEKEQLIYWYRPTPKNVNCDATDTTMHGSANIPHGRPDGWQNMADSVFVVSLLQAPGTVTITSGDNGQTHSFDAPAGARAYSVPMGLGAQSFALHRNGQPVLQDTSMKDIVDECICGIYNFNAYVNTVPPPQTVDRLGPAARARLHNGLQVPCPENTLTRTVAPTATPTVCRN